MISPDYFAISLKNLKRRKLRAFLTMIGIIIAIATIFVLISVSIGLRGSIQEEFRLLGSDKFFVMPKGFTAPGTLSEQIISDSDIDLIKRVAGVKEATEIVVSPTRVEYKNEVRFTNAIGLNLKTAGIYFETGLAGVMDGRQLQRGDSGVVTLGSQYSDAQFFTKSMSVGGKIVINGKEFRVKGFLKPVGTTSDDRQVYLPIENFRTTFNIPTRVDEVIVQIESGSDLKQVSDAVAKKLTSAHGLTEKTRNFAILTPEELLSSFNSILNILTGFLLGISAISLLVGAIGIANTMFTSVLERTKEIGIMKAVGARNSTVLSLFMIESGLLGLVGGLIGVIFGYFTGKIIESIASSALNSSLFKISSPLYLFAGCLAFSFLIGLVSGAWPAWRATKIKPVEALRYE